MSNNTSHDSAERVWSYPDFMRMVVNVKRRFTPSLHHPIPSSHPLAPPLLASLEQKHSARVYSDFFVSFGVLCVSHDGIIAILSAF